VNLSRRPRPIPDRDSAPWWEAVRRHELLLQKCLGCGVLRFPPRAICNACQGRAAAWVPASGTGTVQSWIVSHHVFGGFMATEVPYVVALVRLDEGDDLLMYGNVVTTGDRGEITAVDPAAVTAGMRVRAVFADIDDECTLVQWRSGPASGERTGRPNERHGMAGHV
jgi:uncharacterized OB-fold protein